MFGYPTTETMGWLHRGYHKSPQGTTGQLKNRLEDLKKPWRKEISPSMLQHSETARLAVDAFLEQGEAGYLQAVTQEKELPFLSTLDKEYMSQYSQSISESPVKAGLTKADSIDRASLLSGVTTETYFPLMSDIVPPQLELGWPEKPTYKACDRTEINLYFQRDKTKNVKEIFRTLISKAKTVIAIVMDLFTDMEILSDLMEASSRRHVPVYLILDEKHLQEFAEMCNKMELTMDDFPNIRIRHVTGDTYYSKAGMKLTGQALEKFMLIDCEEVLAGTYSFTWLCSQLHTGLVIHFKGESVEAFDREFRCIYAESKPVNKLIIPSAERTTSSTHKISQKYEPGLKEVQVNKSETTSPSSTISNSSIESIKRSPYLNQQPASFILHEKKEQITKEKRNNVSGLLWLSDMNYQPKDLPNSSLSTSTKLKHPFNEISNLSRIKTSLLSLSSPTLGDSTKHGHDSQFQPENNGLKDNKWCLYTVQPADDVTKTHKNGKLVTSGHSKPELFHKPNKSLNSSCGFLDGAQVQNKSSIHRDEKRMTLGHSKLDMITNYNKSKAKQIHSRFEM